MRMIFTLFTLCTLIFASTAFAVSQGFADLEWTEPALNADGTAISYGPLKYKVYYGTAAGIYSAPIDIGRPTCTGTPSVCKYSVSGLTTGTYYFAVTAYNTLGNESAYSNEINKPVITTTPAAPGGLKATIRILITVP